jgi:predicted N-acetyltransferase YhbS
MTIEQRQLTAQDVTELGRICYEAFGDIAAKHGFPTDVPTIEFGKQIVGMLVQQEEDVYSVGAFEGGAAKGSNYIEMWDDVAGLGPISVDVGSQGQGIGRKLMEDGIAEARRRGHDMIRLCQDAFNMQSLALYASIGFDVKEPLSYLALSDKAPVDANFRPATEADFDAMDELCRSIFRFSRKAECARLLELGFPGFVLDRGRIVGYLLGTMLGHGVAETVDDMVTLLNSHGATVPEAHSFVPLRDGELYRKALAAGHRNRKVMNLMALGPYEKPQGTYCPSILIG